MRAYSQYGLFAHALAYSLLRTWVQHTAAGFKAHLALPPADDGAAAAAAARA